MMSPKYWVLGVGRKFGHMICDNLNKNTCFWRNIKCKNESCIFYIRATCVTYSLTTGVSTDFIDVTLVSKDTW